jgi:hypothetical protein
MQRHLLGLLLAPGVLTALAIAACSSTGGNGSTAPTPQEDAAPVDPVPEEDAGPETKDAGPEVVGLPKCDATKPFGAPAHVPELPSSAYSPSLSDDELTVIFSDNSLKNPGFVTLFEARRANFKAPFGKATELTALHVTGYREETPRISADGKSLVFASNRPGGTGTTVISGFYLAERASSAAAFQVLGLLEIPDIFGSGTEFKKSSPFLTRDQTELWFERSASNPIQSAIWSATVTSSGIGQPVERLTDSQGGASAPNLSADGLSMYYTANDGAASGLNVWKATRAATNAPFTKAAKVVELSSTGDDWLWHISGDGCRAYLRSTRPPEGLFVAAKPL